MAIPAFSQTRITPPTEDDSPDKFGSTVPQNKAAIIIICLPLCFI